MREVLARGWRDAHASVGGTTCWANGEARRIDFLFHGPSLRCEPVPIPSPSAGAPPPSETEPSDHVAISGLFDWS